MYPDIKITPVDHITDDALSLINISEPTRLLSICFCGLLVDIKS